MTSVASVCFGSADIELAAGVAVSEVQLHAWRLQLAAFQDKQDRAVELRASACGWVKASEAKTGLRWPDSGESAQARRSADSDVASGILQNPNDCLLGGLG